MLSKKAQYAFRALTHLAENYNKGPVLISEMAKKKRIPLKFLENILLELKKEDILESKKGRGGGYYLKEHPSKTYIATVIRIVDGPISLLPCVSLYFYQRCKNCNEKQCGLHDMMKDVRDATLKILERRTLKDLV
ncbi:MAG: Rrf2 family transcriptional regulator [Bacteroidetes bacterium]|nr:Rrf2 family transcriptional regulator [Bacteroidota bacterium]MBS1931246.1 Rrf2 family transcriptional regulator [Bacteroidota bacterium]